MKLTPEHISQLIALTGFIGSLVVWGVTLETRMAQLDARVENILKVREVRIEQFQQQIDQLKQDIRQAEQHKHP